MNSERDLEFRKVNLSIETRVNLQYWLLRQEQLERARLGINTAEEIRVRVKRERITKDNRTTRGVFVG